MRRAHAAVARRVAGGMAVAMLAGVALIVLGVAIEHPGSLATAPAQLLARAAEAVARVAPLLAGLGAAGALGRARARGEVRCMEAAGVPRWPWFAWAWLLGACAGACGTWIGARGLAAGAGWVRVRGAWVHGARVIADGGGAGAPADVVRHAGLDPWPAALAALCAVAGTWLASRPRAVSARAPCSGPSGGTPR